MEYLMSGIFKYIWLIVGFFMLIKGADTFVAGAASVARILRVPSIIIGLTIVAMGTSAPETAVSISAALAGSNALSVSNVVGSNFFNLLVVTGVCAAIQSVKMTDSIMKRDFPYSVAFTIVLLFFLSMGLIGGGEVSLTRLDGIILLAAFVIYLVLLVKQALKERTSDDDDEYAGGTFLSPLKSVLYILIGLVGVSLGGQLVVKSSTAIALEFGLTETLIGLTIVAMGTSLPELATSIAASRQGENDLALGNVVGSNIFNILLVLGISSTVSPIVLTDHVVIIDIIILIAVNVIVFLLAFKNKKLGRGAGITMVLMYAAYLTYIIMRDL